MSRGPAMGGIEAGGTKVMCAVGTGPEDVRATTVIATTTPLDKDITNYLVPPALGDQAGVLGATALAELVSSATPRAP